MDEEAAMRVPSEERILAARLKADNERIRAVIKAEREACAQIAIAYSETTAEHCDGVTTARDIAVLIRARKDEYAPKNNQETETPCDHTD